mmetsp:Transcript_20106/g.50935  ORF Transcript_20106/g.50935 Transcript_20106/m.50935 type:complete len:227 (+) Transcript_20106:917-1597(+)
MWESGSFARTLGLQHTVSQQRSHDVRLSLTAQRLRIEQGPECHSTVSPQNTRRRTMMASLRWSPRSPWDILAQRDWKALASPSEWKSIRSMSCAVTVCSTEPFRSLRRMRLGSSRRPSLRKKSARPSTSSWLASCICAAVSEESTRTGSTEVLCRPMSAGCGAPRPSSPTGSAWRSSPVVRAGTRGLWSSSITPLASPSSSDDHRPIARSHRRHQHRQQQALFAPA